MVDEDTHCINPVCDWIKLSNITGLQDVPPLRPNPELSGIGVTLGFSVTAYLTLVLLILHYFTVHDYRRKGSKGREYVNSVDRGILAFTRERILAWTPSRRFEYAMEKAVSILGDTQLVTSLAILASGYSQLNCGISAYHWQIMVYVAWFGSFSHLAAISFLEGYFQTNHSLRIIRVCFMFVLAALLIVALLPTGSHNWLQLLPYEGGFYPGMGAKCYFKQMGEPTYNPRGGPKMWSMIVSILVVGISYLHSGIRLFDPTAEGSRKYFRTWPGSHVKRLLYALELRSSPKGLRAILWQLPYLFVLATFTSVRILYDLFESMLLEIIWLSFAIAWGTIKLYDTRASATYNTEGEAVGANSGVLEESSWSFGQVLPLVLLLLPLMSMAQAYLDNDAKAQDAVYEAEKKEKNALKVDETSNLPEHQSSVCIGELAEGEADAPDPRRSTSCSITRCRHHNTLQTMSTGTDTACDCSISEIDAETQTPITSYSRHHHHRARPSHSDILLPQYPYPSFSIYPWYNDHVLLLILQILVVAAFALFLLNELSNFLGLTVFLRNRIFLIWILGIMPAASLIHLSTWYLGALLVEYLGYREWMVGTTATIPSAENHVDADIDTDTELKGWQWWNTITIGNVVYWVLRMVLVAVLVFATFVVSLEAAGPSALDFSDL